MARLSRQRPVFSGLPPAGSFENTLKSAKLGAVFVNVNH